MMFECAQMIFCFTQNDVRTRANLGMALIIELRDSIAKNDKCLSLWNERSEVIESKN